MLRECSLFMAGGGGGGGELEGGGENFATYCCMGGPILGGHTFLEERFFVNALFCKLFFAKVTLHVS